MSVLAAAGGPRAEAAYVVGGSPWPGGRIAYCNELPSQGRAVRLAAKAWNHSGAHVHFVATSCSHASVVVSAFGAGPRPYCDPGYVAGCASIGRESNGVNHVWLHSAGWRAPSGVRADLREWTMTAAHELGHVLGLDHEHHHCATMDAGFFNLCPKGFWKTTASCRPLQRDDELGAVHLYGGHARRPEKLAFCANLAPPRDVKVRIRRRHGRYPVIHVHWRATDPLARTVTLRPRRGACPHKAPRLRVDSLATDALQAAVYGRKRRAFRVRRAYLRGVGWGRYCFILYTQDRHGRSGRHARMVSARIPAVPPTAAFKYGPAFGSFTDKSRDSSSDGSIVSWSWSFGDPASGRANRSSHQDPRHVFKKPGTYKVTLTVKDDSHLSASVSRQVTVALPAPIAAFRYVRTPGYPLSVDFNDVSHDPSDHWQIESWSWNFGDPASGGESNTATDEFPEHEFSGPGTYTVTLTVKSTSGLSGSVSHQVTVGSK